MTFAVVRPEIARLILDALDALDHAKGNPPEAQRVDASLKRVWRHLCDGGDAEGWILRLAGEAELLKLVNKTQG